MFSGARTPGRKTTPRVKDGRTQKKNRVARTPDLYRDATHDTPMVLRERPGIAHRHLVTRAQLLRFVSLLPDWAELSQGIDVLFLAPASARHEGWYRSGTVALCAWERALTCERGWSWTREHARLLERLEVRVEQAGRRYYSTCHFDEWQARAYQLIHVLVHELGHHHDARSNRANVCARGEGYAERYAIAHEDAVWNCYTEVFGPRPLPAAGRMGAR